MKTAWLTILLAGFAFTASLTAAAPADFERDDFPAAGGLLQITFIGHGSLLITHGGKHIYIDPVSRYAEYSQMPKADLILITHQHGDHLDPTALAELSKTDTTVVLTRLCAETYPGGTVLGNGEEKTLQGVRIQAVPAYNLVHKRGNGQPFHPKGEGNGYVLTVGGKRIYVAGDTEDIPEMASLKSIDIAFLPMNLPYTMTPGMVVRAALLFKPKILYPYHYGDTDPELLRRLLQDHPEIEVRLRRLS